MSRSTAPAYKWVILFLAMFVQIGVSLLQQSPSALGPVLTQDLGLSRAQVGLLTSAIIGGMTFTTLIVGLLIDRRGERSVVFIGVSMMALLVITATQSSTFGWLFILFLLASFGASTSTPGGSKAITSWFARRQRGLAMGVRQTGVPAGGLVAAVLLPPLAVAFGWRMSLAAGAGIALTATVLFVLFYREMPREEKIDRGDRVPLGLIVGNRSFLAATGYSLVLVGAQWAATAYLTLYLNETVGIPVVVAGILLAALQVGGIVGRIGWGMVSDLTGRRKPILVGVSLLAVVTALAMGLTGAGTPLVVIAPLCALLGLSLLGWNGLYITVIAESVPVRAAATALGAGLTVTNMGSFLVPPAFGLLIDITGSYTIFWFALAAWISIGALLVMLVQES